MTDIITLILGLIIGYGFGSVPFGLVLTKLAGLGDIRAVGSGNIGATNVLRTGRKDLAILTLLGDSGKGAVAVVICSFFIGEMAAIGAALGGVLGHLFPVWLNFKGGKGVATTLGVMIALTPVVGFLACLIWLVTAFITRISSLSALIASLCAPFIAGLVYGEAYSILYTVIAMLVWVKHRDNIKRIVNKTEPKIGQKK